MTIATAAPTSPTVGQMVTPPLAYTATTDGATPIARVRVRRRGGRLHRTAGSSLPLLLRLRLVRRPGDGHRFERRHVDDVHVGPRPHLVVTFSSSPASPTPNAPTTAAIAATSTTGNAITSITVDWGDGSQQTLAGSATSAQQVYTTAGTYTVIATATNSSGTTGVASTVIVVTGGGGRPTVTIGSPPLSPTEAPSTCTRRRALLRLL